MYWWFISIMHQNRRVQPKIAMKTRDPLFYTFLDVRERKKKEEEKEKTASRSKKRQKRVGRRWIG